MEALKKHTIQEMMQVKGMSREAVAAACEVTGMTVTNWLKKPASMRIGYALKLAQAFDVPVEAISFLPEK